MTSRLSELTETIDHWHPATKWITALGVSATLAYLDYWTGREISFSIFYLMPVVFVTWFIGRNGGIVLTLLSALEWHLAGE